MCELRDIPIYCDAGEERKIGKKHLPKNEIKAEDIERSESGMLLVKSQSIEGLKYEVDPQRCLCSCPAGWGASICKHLVGVHVNNFATLYTFPPMTLKGKNEIHEIAFGVPPPNPDWYANVIINSKKRKREPHDVTIYSSNIKMESPVNQREFSDVQMKEQENKDSEETVETQSVFSQSFDDFALEKMKAILPSFKSFENDPDVRKTVEKLLRKWKIRMNKSKKRRQQLAKFLQIVHQYLEGNQELVKAVHEQKEVNQDQEGITD